jgi:hydrogenase nickel incorporation protein HypA/HybF
MHELSVTESILQIALKHARAGNAQYITDIFLVIGDLSSIVDDSVQFYWDHIAAGTIAEGAKLHFRRIPAELECLSCGSKYQPEPGELICPECSSADVRIVKGDEFFMEAIEVTENKPERCTSSI